MRLDLTLLSLSLVVATPLAYAQTKPSPKADATVASYVARGAAEPAAVCAAHTGVFVRTPGPVKKFSFEDAQLTSARIDEWNAPFAPGETKKVEKMVTMRASAELRSGGPEKTYEVKCGVVGTKVLGFTFRDVAVPIKTKS